MSTDRCSFPTSLPTPRLLVCRRRDRPQDRPGGPDRAGSRQGYCPDRERVGEPRPPARADERRLLHQSRGRSLQWHALQMSLDAFAVHFGDSHMATGPLARRAMRLIASPAHLRSNQLRNGPGCAAMALCTRPRCRTLDTQALGDQRRPGPVTVNHRTSVSQDRAEERRVVRAHKRQ